MELKVMYILQVFEYKEMSDGESCPIAIAQEKV